MTKKERAENGRCQRCLGMGYKGRSERGKWRVRTCPRCGGRGLAPGWSEAPRKTV